MSDKLGPAWMPEALKIEADHRIANNLAMLGGLMRLHAAEAERSKPTYTAAEVSLLLRELSARVETVGTLHRILADAPDDSFIGLDGFLHEISTNLCSLSGKQVSLSVNCICSESIEAGKALPIGFVVAELITNSLKHAHPSGVPLILRVVAKQNIDTSVCIEVSDDGVGYPEGFNPFKDGGLGFRVMRSLAEQLNARFQFTSTELGVSCAMTVPPRKSAAHPTAFQPTIVAGRDTEPSLLIKGAA